MWQELAVSIVLVAAVGYAGYRIYRTLTDKNEACKGCPLAENCTKKKGCKNCGSDCFKC